MGGFHLSREIFHLGFMDELFFNSVVSDYYVMTGGVEIESVADRLKHIPSPKQQGNVCGGGGPG